LAPLRGVLVFANCLHWEDQLKQAGVPLIVFSSRSRSMVRKIGFLLVAMALVAPLAHADGDAHEKLGTVKFPTSCSAAVQPQFERAVAMLHSFWLDEGAKTFAAVAQADPGCAMAHWGTAMTLFGNPFGWPLTGAALTNGWAAVERAQAAQAKTPRERDYIAAITAFYKDADKVEHRTRALAYVTAMEKLYKTYPEDSEAAVFYALSLDATAQVTDKTFANQLKAASILEPVFAAQPDHPGVAHYLIHSYDFPPIAEKGLPAARRYAAIAPAAPHALHMPGHIFTRRGLWDESIDTNMRSAQAAKVHSEVLHAMDYLAYAYLQEGRDGDAQRVAEHVRNLGKMNNTAFNVAFGLALIPSRYALERGQWADAAKLELYPAASEFPWKNYPQAESQLVFARAIGSARQGNAPAVRENIARLQMLKAAMLEMKTPYWPSQSDIQIRAASALAAYAEGNKPEALTLMREAAELEAASEKHSVTPGYLVPVRELLGDLLLDMGQGAAALAAYETSHKVEPNRFRGIAGAARAAELAGEPMKARAYYRELVKLAAKSDGSRPELKQAQAYLAKK
jgi:hypothetical protein